MGLDRCDWEFMSWRSNWTLHFQAPGAGQTAGLQDSGRVGVTKRNPGLADSGVLAAAERLAREADLPALLPEVERQLVECQLEAGAGGQSVDRYEPITMAIAALLVSVASLGWTIYTDLKKANSRRRMPRSCSVGSVWKSSFSNRFPWLTAIVSSRWSSRRLWRRLVMPNSRHSCSGGERSRSSQPDHRSFYQCGLVVRIVYGPVYNHRPLIGRPTAWHASRPPATALVRSPSPTRSPTSTMLASTSTATAPATTTFEARPGQHRHDLPFRPAWPASAASPPARAPTRPPTPTTRWTAPPRKSRTTPAPPTTAPPPTPSRACPTSSPRSNRAAGPTPRPRPTPTTPTGIA